MKTTSGLDPWRDAPYNPWDRSAISHLYRRTAFAPKFPEVTAALSSNVSTIVDSLLDPLLAPAPPSWGSDLPFTTPLTTQQQQIYTTRIRELREWWIRLMLTQPLSLTEKMTLFLHGHFASEYDTVQVPQYMYIQNALFRRYALGNFKDLVKAVAVDPAMLIYLDGVKNRVGSPNENFARELLELFTIGIGNYTQTDIQNAARALTGWTVVGLNAVYVPSRHDTGTKTFMGQTGNFDGNDIIDIVFQQPATATFICQKLYKFFVYQVPNDNVVNQLATVFRNNNYELAPVLRALFTSNHFFDPLIRSAQISGPIERIVGAIRQLNITVSPTSNVIPAYVRGVMESLGQTLFDPPNVAGWPGYRQWISTTTLLQRNVTTDAIVSGRSMNNTNIGFKVNPVPFAMQFHDPNDPYALIDDFCSHLLALPASQARKDVLLATLLQGIEPYDWRITDPQAASRIEGLLKVIFRMAEYQLV